MVLMSNLPRLSPEMSWILGFERGVHNDPPDDCPHPQAAAATPDYDVGWRTGKLVARAAKVGPSGGRVTVDAPAGALVVLDGASIGISPCVHDCGTGAHVLTVGGAVTRFSCDPSAWTETLVSDGVLSQTFWPSRTDFETTCGITRR